MRAYLAFVLALTTLFGVASSVRAAPVKLLCKGVLTVVRDNTETTPSPFRVGVEIDEAAAWIRFKPPISSRERLPITSSGGVVTFTDTFTSASDGVVSNITGRIEPGTGRLYFDNTISSAMGAGERFEFWGVEMTTLRTFGDVPCRTP